MPKRRQITNKQLAALYDELQTAPRGTKTAVVAAAAAAYGVNPATLRRQLDDMGLGSGITRPRAKTEQYEAYRVWTKTLMTLALKCQTHTIPLKLALRSAVKKGHLPPEAKDVPVETYHRLARELGYREMDRRVNAVWSDTAHEVVVFDASHSQFFSVVKQLDDGDYLLRLDRRPRIQKEYKNKPVSKERLRLLYYTAWEMHSGAHWQRACVAKGENGGDAIDFLVAYMSAHPDPRDPVRGKMQTLWCDNGPLAKNKSVLDLLDRLNIDLIPGVPYAKERQGGAEQSWKRLWKSFESTFFMALEEDGAPGTLAAGEITLSELNARLLDFLHEHNTENKARFQPGLNKLQAWKKSADAQGGLEALPPHALETLVTVTQRFVGANGTFQWDNRIYEVEKIFKRHVYAYRSLEDANRITVEDIETGQKYEAWPFQPQMVGDFRAHELTPVQEARRDGATIAADSPYEPVNAPNVVAFPTKTQAPAPLYDHLDAGRFDSLEEALLEFTKTHGMPEVFLADPALHAKAVARIVADGLSKAKTRELALAMRQLAKSVQGQ